MASQYNESENANFNHINNGLDMPKEQPMKVESNDCSVELATCKPKKCVENCSVLCNGNSVVEQLIDINSDSPIVGQEMATSEDDSENEVFHAIPVKKQNNDGLNSVPKDDEPLLILTDDHAKNCEATSVTVIPQLSLPNALQNDDVYAKFFAALFRK
ncbi:hypothetical protein LOAG_16974 [Loa loa]|nr:hypothetical protein LOAG_16974 [Loa loa]EJD75976.1 hypothetical protein LOAG_16974 [Loa loa]